MAAILIFTQPRRQGLQSEKTLRERLRSAKTRGEWGPKLVSAATGDGFSFVCLFLYSDQFLTGMRYQAKLLTLSPYCAIIYAIILLSGADPGFC